MRKALLVVLALVIAAPTLEAGGGAVIRRRVFPGGEMMALPAPRRPRQPMRRRGGRMSIFYVIRRYFDLTDEQTAGVDKLAEQRATEEREAIAELTKKLDKKYIALICEVLPAEEKAKYQQVLAAMNERDEIIEAARKEFREILAKLRAEQGVETKSYYARYLPYSKTDLLRRTINLSAEQRKEADGIRRDSYAAMREVMRNIKRPKDWRDADARREYMAASKKARAQVNEETVTETLRILTDDQKKAYETASAAMDAYKKKAKEAEDACEKKMIELIGEDKVRPVRGLPPKPGKKPTQF